MIRYIREIFLNATDRSLYTQPAKKEREYAMSPDFICNRITELRLKKGVTDAHMSRDFGHSKGYMNKISKGMALPSLAEFLVICEYLGVTPEVFFVEGCSNPYLLDKLIDEAKNLSDEDVSLLIKTAERFKLNT